MRFCQLKKYFIALVVFLLSLASAGCTASDAKKKFGSDSLYFIALSQLNNGNEKSAYLNLKKCAKKGSYYCARKSMEKLCEIGPLQEKNKACLELLKKYNDAEAVKVAATQFFTSKEYGKVIEITKKSSIEDDSNALIKARLEAVSELKDNFNIVLELQNKLISIDNINDTNFSEYSNLLEEKVTPNKKELLFAIITSIISDIILILGIFNIIPFIFFILVMIIQTIISYIYLYFHNEIFENLTNCTRKLSTLKNIYEYIVTLDFKSNKLNKIQKEIEEGYTTFKELVRINDLNNLRSNFITNVIFNTIMSLNIITIYKYSKLLTNKKEIIESIKSLEQLESILSLSTICFIKKDICIPTISKDTKISFTNIKHPLLEEDKCISNNFKTNKGINIITGTNMSGKSSFMKTIGINLILMEAGTYVEATSFTSSLMKIFSSIKVEDDINNNISTFYGELLRIKKILDYSKKNNESLVIFIDEIFKGTNYNDRIYGAKEIIKKLSELDAITFITTHDYELCDNKNVNNYHFEENYKDTNITFDYKLKEGKCMTTNAKYLMEKLGIIEGDK